MGNSVLNRVLRGSLLSAAAIAPLGIAIAAPADNLNAAVVTPLMTTTSLLATAQVVAPQTPPATPGNDANDPVGLEDVDEDDDETEEDEKNIVVTGTLIRGTAATGTNPITVGEEQIDAVAATRGSEILASLPQIANNFFNGIPQTEQINATSVPGTNQTTNRPSLRPNPFGSTDRGNSTLILLDGARMSGIGVNGVSANPDAVPPALLQRVEINPDGGSATYGSDAIGGVINFITRRRFDGIRVGGAVGLADDYTTWEANAVAGADWSTGGAYIGYSFAKNDVLLNRERDFYLPRDFATGLRRDLACDIPNIRVPNAGLSPFRYYAAPPGSISGPFTVVAGAVSGTPNVCSLGEIASLASANEQHNVLARISQDLSEDIAVGLRLRFSDQKQEGLTGPSTFAALVTNANPFFRPITSGPDAGATSYTVLGNFGPVMDESERIFRNSARQWGALADLTWDIGEWRLAAFANYDHSKSDYSNPALNPAFSAGGFQIAAGTSTCSVQRTAAACLSPFDIGASNPTLISNVLNFFNIGESEDTIINFRGVLDGPLFDLPGGPLRVAVGAEYLHDEFSNGLYQGTTPSDLRIRTLVQTAKSVFGEVNAPLISEQNEIPLIRELRLSAAGRYDHYSDFGGTFNPKLGASWMPFEFLTLRGNWSKTFRAPTTVDLIGTARENTTISVNSAAVFFCFACDFTKPLPGATDVRISLGGTKPGVGPQRGENWSFGADLAYAQFRASVTYYRINYLDILANPANGTPIFPNLAHLAILCPGTPGNYQCTQAQVDAFTSQAASAAPAANVPLTSIYSLNDHRADNLGNARVGGWDYSFQFTQPADWGSVFAAVAGSFMTLNESQALPHLPFVSNISLGLGNVGAFNLGRSLHRMSVRTGVNYGAFRAQATLNHNSGYDVVRSATLLQDRVDAFNTVNLFFSYEFDSPSVILDGLELSLNINNVFDTDPPDEFSTNSGNGWINGSTLGRLIKIGIQKKI